MELDKTYWENRYLNNRTEWDAGSITTPLKEYFDQLTNKTLQILIPGAGNGHEAVYLHQSGFPNVTVLDLATQPLENIRHRIPTFPKSNLIQGDFFDHKGSYDLIMEQTFFCAINPADRMNYAEKAAELMAPGGKLIGVLFNTDFVGGPPFGGNADEYINYFSPWFNFKIFEPCYNSIKPRSGKELFIILEKK